MPTVIEANTTEYETLQFPKLMIRNVDGGVYWFPQADQGVRIEGSGPDTANSVAGDFSDFDGVLTISQIKAPV